jgi:hypothetical protein
MKAEWLTVVEATWKMSDWVISLFKNPQSTRGTMVKNIVLALLLLGAVMKGTNATETAFGSMTEHHSGETRIAHDASKKIITLSTSDGSLILRLVYDGRCVIERVWIKGRQVVSTGSGVYCATKQSGTWHTTLYGIDSPKVVIEGNTVIISGIRFGGSEIPVIETWRFRVMADRIMWRIERKYEAAGTLDETCFPGWDFERATWTAAFLDNGGVAWNKLIDRPNATYGAHVEEVSFWNADTDACLRIAPDCPPEQELATRFSRQPDGTFSFSYSVTDEWRTPAHARRRFLPNRQDVWAPFQVSPKTVAMEYTLTGLSYDAEYDRGTIPYFDEGALRALCNTIARVGVVDTLLHGTNGWRSGYAVLHEQWVAQLGLAINAPAYFEAYKKTLDYFRDHAVGVDGRVKPRWSYTDGDAAPGTYDRFGFYECQWGPLMDSNPDFVINVAELFDFTGDVQWVRGHKETCERALDYMLARDSDGDGLVEMMNDSHTEGKGSDWIDVIWASYENAFVNAEMYHALQAWAGIEELLDDAERGEAYRHAAEKLKKRFNEATSAGGFWDADNQWYVHWRDKDDSIHGSNLVVPVNFMAIGYGICDDAARRTAILSRIETEMNRENLFCWPLCVYPYAEGEGHPLNFPFPAYENGDIFLGWGELGVRAYAEYDPRISIRYIQNVLDKYEEDGLAFQRYLRESQTGKGDDILANNCSPVVGLYRDVYGIQPKYNRLYLAPHLVPELNGTRLKYWVRDRLYTIDLSVDDYAIGMGNFSVRAHHDFGVNSTDDRVEYFGGNENTPSLSVTLSEPASLEIVVDRWESSADGSMKWTESSTVSQARVQHAIAGLAPQSGYVLHVNDGPFQTVSSDESGRLNFTYAEGYDGTQTFELRPEQTADSHPSWLGRGRRLR